MYNTKEDAAMNKLFILLVLPIALIVSSAFAETDIQGCWSVEVNCIGEAPPHPYETFIITIEQQSPIGLFEVYNCSDEIPNPCYGAIDKKNIYITCWDNIITGQIGKNGTEMKFITQNQNCNEKEAGTCKGTAIKISNPPCSCP